MFDHNVLNGLKTVGAFVIYKKSFAFMIGPDKSGEKLGIIRLGGHIEEDEDYLKALERELFEEASIKGKLISSPLSFYKETWCDEKFYKIEEHVPWDIEPLIIVGNKKESTACFLVSSEEEPVPSSESHGIIFLDENNIRDICTKRLCLKDFLYDGGRLIEQIKLDYNMEIYAGPHLLFLNELYQKEKELINDILLNIR